MESTPDFTWLFIKMVAGLILVLGLAVVLVRFVLPRTRLGKGRGTDWARLVGRVPIEPRKGLYLVRILERYFVLGGAENSLQVVTELSREEGEKIENG